MEDRLIVTASPHIRDTSTTRGLMGNVVIALLPAVLAAGLIFGVQALVLVAVTTLACVAFEYIYEKLLKKPNTVGDLSAVVTGIILALNMPVGMPLWIAVVGAFVAIIITKQLFGGLGKNFMNPALGGRAFLMLCYPVAMTTWVAPGIGTGAWADLLGGTKTMAGVDIVSSATPLSADFMHGGLLPDATILDAFVGNVGGCIGEISALALLLGALRPSLVWLAFLLSEGAEPVVPGLTDFIIFKIYNREVDVNIYGGKWVKKKVCQVLKGYVEKCQRAMIAAMKKGGFRAPGTFEDLRRLIQGYLGEGNKMGEGWLLTAEMLELIHSGTPNIVCTQPFGCLPNHIVGKGMIRKLKDDYPFSNIVAIDYDPGATKINQENRIKLMLANARGLAKQEAERREAGEAAHV